MDFSFLFHKKGNEVLAELEPVAGIISDIDDATDLLGNGSFAGAKGIIIRQEQLPASFFELRSGLAGEILQKFSNYRMKLAIIGDFKEIKSKALQDFIRESNKTGHIIFPENLEEALDRL